QGRVGPAMRGWSRVLEVRPDAQTVARLGLAHALRKDGVSLATLRAVAESKGLKGRIQVEGRARELLEYLDSLGPARAPETAAPPPKPAAAPDSEIPLGHYDLKEDGRYGERLAVSLPAAGVANGKDLVLVSNGLRVTAIAPARAEGGAVDDAIEWRFPKPGPTRTWTLGTYNSLALPYVGVTVSGGLAFCPMFPERQEARQQMGRRQQRFLGPSVLRAIDLATGESVWDTDSVTVDGSRPAAAARPTPGAGRAPAPPPADSPGTRVPLIEYLNLDKSDFCFGGPRSSAGTASTRRS